MPPKQGKDAKQGKGGPPKQAPNKATVQSKDAKGKPGAGPGSGSGGGGAGAPGGQGNKGAKGAPSAAKPSVTADKKQRKEEKAQAEAERRAAAEKMFDFSDESQEEEEEEAAEDVDAQVAESAVDHAASQVESLKLQQKPLHDSDVNTRGDRRENQAQKNSKDGSRTTGRDAKEAREARREAMRAPEATSVDETVLTTSLDAFSVTIAGSLPGMMASMQAEKRAVKDIILEDFSISLPGRAIYQNATLKLSHGHRYGFIGPNGQGKSTLLRFLAAKALPVPAEMRVVLIEQESAADSRSAIDFLLACDEERAALLQEEEELLQRLEAREGETDAGEGAEHLAGVLKRMEEVEKALEGLGAAGAEARARRILSGLGFSEAMMEQSLLELSGGWRKRAALGRGLYMDPDLLLLDEPTNHLDLEAVLWLSSYLQGFSGTLVVVSHDQAFLEEVATDMLVLAKQRLRLYRGGYEQYERGSAQEEAEAERSWRKQEEAIKREIAKGKSRQEATEALCKEREREGRGLVEEPGKAYSVNFKFSDPDSDGPACSLHGVTFGYDRQQPPLLRDVTCNLAGHSRVAVMGSNGCGKSTLLKLVAGMEEPWEGEVCHGAGLRIGYYSQHLEFAGEERAVDWLCRQPGCGNEQHARKTLGHFGLAGAQHLMALGKLSGGQRARVGLAGVSVMKSHLMVLDEPTNHLDMESIQGLTQGLKAFGGGVVLVTHDMRLLRELEAEVWVVQGSEVSELVGGCDAYRRRVLKAVAEKEAKAEEAAARRERERRRRRERARGSR